MNVWADIGQVSQDDWSADFVEFTFQDNYLGRNEMWRLGQYLVGQCVFVDQEIPFIGAAVVKVHAVYVAGKKVRGDCPYFPDTDNQNLLVSRHQPPTSLRRRRWFTAHYQQRQLCSSKSAGSCGSLLAMANVITKR